MEIPKILTNENRDKLTDIITDWDTFKERVKKIAIYHSTKRKRIQKMEKLELNRQINNADTPIRDKEKFSKQLEKIEHHETKGMEIRAGKFHHIYKQGRDLFKREEKMKGGEKTLDTLIVNGREITTKAEIMKEVQNYYTTLYTSQNIDNDIIHEYLNSIQCEKISSVHKDLCDDLISVDEVIATIKELAKGKAPG